MYQEETSCHSHLCHPSSCESGGCVCWCLLGETRPSSPFDTSVHTARGTAGRAHETRMGGGYSWLWAFSQLLFSAGCCSWSDRKGQFTLLIWPHLKLQAHTLKPAEGDRHEDMHQFFSPFSEQGFCPRGAVCGQVPFSEDFYRSTCLPYSTQVRFTAAGLGRCMEASEAEVKH